MPNVSVSSENFVRKKCRSYINLFYAERSWQVTEKAFNDIKYSFVICIELLLF